MPQKIILIIVGLLILAGGFVVALIVKKGMKKDEKNLNNDEEAIAQDFVNVLDIDNDGILYTADNYLMLYIKVSAVALDLLTSSEKKSLQDKLTSSLSGFQKPWKFLALSRPIDIQPLINSYTEIMSNTDDMIKRKLLRNSIRQIGSYALTGEVTQRQFFFCIWEKAKDKNAISELKKQGDDMVYLLSSASLEAEVIKREDIIRLINLINNPSTTAYENTDVLDMDIIQIYQ